MLLMLTLPGMYDDMVCIRTRKITGQPERNLLRIQAVSLVKYRGNSFIKASCEL